MNSIKIVEILCQKAIPRGMAKRGDRILKKLETKFITVNSTKFPH